MHVEEARQLVEASFECVTEVEGAKIFRKRKQLHACIRKLRKDEPT